MSCHSAAAHYDFSAQLHPVSWREWPPTLQTVSALAAVRVPWQLLVHPWGGHISKGMIASDAAFLAQQSYAY